MCWSTDYKFCKNFDEEARLPRGDSERNDHSSRWLSSAAESSTEGRSFTSSDVQSNLRTSQTPIQVPSTVLPMPTETDVSHMVCDNESTSDLATTDGSTDTSVLSEQIPPSDADPGTGVIKDYKEKISVPDTILSATSATFAPKGTSPQPPERGL